MILYSHALLSCTLAWFKMYRQVTLESVFDAIPAYKKLLLILIKYSDKYQMHLLVYASTIILPSICLPVFSRSFKNVLQFVDSLNLDHSAYMRHNIPFKEKTH